MNVHMFYFELFVRLPRACSVDTEFFVDAALDVLAACARRSAVVFKVRTRTRPQGSVSQPVVNDPVRYRRSKFEVRDFVDASQLAHVNEWATRWYLKRAPDRVLTTASGCVVRIETSVRH